MQLAASTDNRKFCLLTDNFQDVWEDVMGGLFSTLNAPDPLLNAVPANGSDGPHCLPVPLCLKGMQVLQRNQDHCWCGSQFSLHIQIWNRLFTKWFHCPYILGEKCIVIKWRSLNMNMLLCYTYLCVHTYRDWSHALVTSVSNGLS